MCHRTEGKCGQASWQHSHGKELRTHSGSARSCHVPVVLLLDLGGLMGGHRGPFGLGIPWVKGRWREWGLKCCQKATTASCHLGQVGTGASSSLWCPEKPSCSLLLLHQQSKRSHNPAQPPPTALSQSYCSFSTKETNLLCRRAGHVINEKLCSI